MSQLQKLAKNRNWLKYQLSGKRIHYTENTITIPEFKLIEEINSAIGILLKHFDKQSVELGLKVPEYRCYFSPCRCKVKYKGIMWNEEVWFCKKHFNEYLEVYGLDTV